MSAKFLKPPLLAVVLFAAGCAVPAAPVVGDDPGRAAVKRIQPRLAALRGLQFKAEVPVETKSRAAMSRDFERELDEEYGADGLKKKALAYGKLGLVPENVDLKKSLLDFYDAQVLAFYDPKGKRLVMPERLPTGVAPGSPDAAADMVLAHELTHALQDQNFAVGDKMTRTTDDDGDLALRAIIEGDATLSGIAYTLGGLNREVTGKISREFRETVRETRAALPDVPEAIVEEMLFQYSAGVAFVARLLEERGWPGVDLAYAAPPLSTEQLLHPEKYFSVPDPPTRIELADLGALFPAGWSEIENNVLGELMVRVLFKQFLPEDEANAVAEGWDGDRFVAFRRGAEVGFVWASVWDSERDAEEFVRGYARLGQKKYAGKSAADDVFIGRRGRRAIVVEGLNQREAGDKIEKIWQGMRATEAAFKSPFATAPHLLPGVIEESTP